VGHDPDVAGFLEGKFACHLFVSSLVSGQQSAGRKARPGVAGRARRRHLALSVLTPSRMSLLGSPCLIGSPGPVTSGSGQKLGSIRPSSAGLPAV
jgi:hypothetical protein